MKISNCSYWLLLLVLSNVFISYGGQFKAYNEYVNKAEMNIIDQNYKSALQFYKQAFEQKENPFATDLYNASVAAIRVGNYDQAFTFCQKLAMKGVGSNFFEKKTIFQPLRKETDWKNLIELAAKEKYSKELKHGETIRWINGLVDKDQEWHTMWGESDFNHTLEMQVAAADDSISMELMKVFTKHGYLSEDRIGVGITNDTTIDYPAYWIVMLHNYQGRNNTEDTLFTPILKKALADEKISPRFFAYIQDHGSNMGIRPVYGTGRSYNIWECNLYKYPTNAIRISDIETNRRNIGLPTLAEDEQRIFYMITRKNKDFIIAGQVGMTGSFADKASEERFLESSILVLTDICK